MRVIPVDLKDQVVGVEQIRSILYLVASGVFNDNLLHATLDTLIRDHLPILGARLRKNTKTGWLEYHLPEEFPDKYALFGWRTSQKVTTLEDAGLLPDNIATHPVTGKVTVPEIRAALVPPIWPSLRKEEKPDCPLLLVHVAKYKNGTVLVLNIPHVVCDQVGFGSLIRAWLDIAAGREPEPFLQLDHGEMDGDADLPITELKRKGELRLRSAWAECVALIPMVWESLMKPKVSDHIWFFPSHTVEGLRDKYNDMLAEAGKDLTVTSGDVVASLCFKLAYLTRKSPKRVRFSCAVNARGRCAMLPTGKPYLHNALRFGSYGILINRDTPLFDLTVQHRLAVQRATNPDTFTRDMAVMHQIALKRRTLGIMEPFELVFSMSNWVSAWRGIDFSPIMTHKADHVLDGRATVYGSIATEESAARFHGRIMCKANGGYWCDFATTSKTKAAIEELFNRDPSLCSL